MSEHVGRLSKDRNWSQEDGVGDVPPNCAKRLECVGFSDAFRLTVAAPPPRAVLKPPQSRRFATADTFLALPPGLSPVVAARLKGELLEWSSPPRTFDTGPKASAKDMRRSFGNNHS